MEARNRLEEYVSEVKMQLQAEHAATDRLKAALAKSEEEKHMDKNHRMGRDVCSPALQPSTEILINHLLLFLSQTYRDIAVRYRDPTILMCPNGSFENILQAANHVSNLSNLCSRYFTAIHVCFQAILGVVCTADMAANSILMYHESSTKGIGLASQADSLSGLEMQLLQYKADLQSTLNFFECLSLAGVSEESCSSLDSAGVLPGIPASCIVCTSPFIVIAEFLQHLPVQEHANKRNVINPQNCGFSEQSNCKAALKPLRSSLDVLNTISEKLNVLSILS